MRCCAARDANNAEMKDCKNRPNTNPHRLIFRFGQSIPLQGLICFGFANVTHPVDQRACIIAGDGD
jgi:hypothetical protein